MHSNIMGALHPAGSLYERPVNMRQCTLQHEAFRAALRANGVHCLTVREILLFDTARDVRARVELEDLAASRLRYELDPRCEERLVQDSDMFYVGDVYKRTVLESSSAEQLVDIVLTGPTVHVMPSFRDTGFTARYSFEPLTNVQFTRDQQVTTAKGIVMARLRSPQRQCESELLAFCFRKIGLPIIGAVAAPAYLEVRHSRLAFCIHAPPSDAFTKIRAATSFRLARTCASWAWGCAPTARPPCS
jgi:arginine deiminase